MFQPRLSDGLYTQLRHDLGKRKNSEIGMAGKDQKFHVDDLEPKDAERWFDVDMREGRQSTRVNQLDAWLNPGPHRKAFRLVAADTSGRDVAKIGGYTTRGGRLTFWAVRHARNVGKNDRLALSTLLIDACLARARSDPGVLIAETQPAFDTPELDIFLDALTDAGFVEVERSHMFSWDGNITALTVDNHSLFLACQRLPWQRLLDLFANSQSGRPFREDRPEFKSVSADLQDLRDFVGEEADGPLWFCKMIGDESVGYALCDYDPGSHEGIIIELGVHPEWRGRGFAVDIVTEAIRRLTSSGAMKVSALIDDRNDASLAIHAKLGFERQSGPYMTWRCSARSH